VSPAFLPPPPRSHASHSLALPPVPWTTMTEAAQSADEEKPGEPGGYFSKLYG